MRNLRMNHFLFALVLLLLPSLASVANACTCGGVSPCEAYASASVVFVGRVTEASLKSTPRSFPANSVSTTLINGGVLSARFKIEEAFLGVKVAQIEISGEGTTCDFPFKSGERYLVFAYKNAQTGTFHTNICSGTAPLAESSESVAYLRSVAKRLFGGTLSGEVFREVHKEDDVVPEPISKTEIILENGKERFTGLSDANGKFEVRGIKPGRYRVRTLPATNDSHLDPMATEPRSEWELDVPAHGCVQTWFAVRPGGEISGRIVDSSGTVAEDIYPELLVSSSFLFANSG